VTVEHLDYDRASVRVTWQDDHEREFPSLWLFDNNPVNRDPRTGQRLIDVADLPLNPAIAKANHNSGDLQVSWADGSMAAFPLEWLKQHCPGDGLASLPRLRLWHAGDRQILRRFPYSEILDSRTRRLEWLESIASTGIAFLSDVPQEDQRVLEVAALVGWVRETNYGRTFDVRAVTDPNNLAYTSLALSLHTDNPYRDPVPGLQMLHCLQADSQGGNSAFADGFAVAEVLRSEDPEAFRVLSSTPVRFEFSDSTCHLWSDRPIIELDSTRNVVAIHYNSRSIAPLRLAPKTIPEFYRSYRALALLLRGSEHVLTTRLQEGDLVTFDNQRVLHGRTAYIADGGRHLQGCYLDRDGLLSQIAVLSRNGQESNALR
jgi:gamma-butyrobetaine dioxygenase